MTFFLLSKYGSCQAHILSDVFGKIKSMFCQQICIPNVCITPLNINSKCNWWIANVFIKDITNFELRFFLNSKSSRTLRETEFDGIQFPLLSVYKNVTHTFNRWFFILICHFVLLRGPLQWTNFWRNVHKCSVLFRSYSGNVLHVKSTLLQLVAENVVCDKN